MCALCGVKGSQATGKTHFKVPTAVGDQPQFWSSLRVNSSLLSQGHSGEHPKPIVGESILVSG